MGICPGVSIVRKNVDLVVRQSDKKLRLWKSQIESQTKQVISLYGIFCYKIVFGLVDVNIHHFFEFATVNETRGHAYKVF